MRTDKIRKYVLPNIPYLFIGWACLKMGTAYRLAAGANFGEKLLGLMQTIGVAFADFSPGLNPADWLVGIVGAVGFRLLIYVKSKNAKKYRRDEEYGSSRWGGPKDIQPFVDPKFENNVILTGTELLTMNTRPKIPANARNLNACIIGSSGSGKTRFWLTPQLLQAHSSYVVVDPKGGVLGQVGYFLQKKRGYKIKVFNSIDFSKSIAVENHRPGQIPLAHQLDDLLRVIAETQRLLLGDAVAGIVLVKAGQDVRSLLRLNYGQIQNGRHGGEKNIRTGKLVLHCRVHE